ncbi:FAD-binding oxidoreductase [Scopulibacillus cellulosilyticus]|uniref:FAD-binding oxidoreductase n=1 Tax=Scopulibacillus cellulosilyticus TaxID=2665665 RepID=A0ABW2PU79_9BACL
MVISDLRTIVEEDQLKEGDFPHQLGNNGLYHVFPRSENEIAAILKYANQNGKKIIPVSGGTKRGFGGTTDKADILLSLSQFKGILEHTTGDLTMTVRPGTTIKEMMDYLANRGQMIPIDPAWPEHATIGGVISANDSGPKRLKYGSARDFVIGLRVVYPDGRVIRTGGKVVKNVAGYDMNKLFVGSMGTLGVISEVTLKLRPLPKYKSLIVLTFSEEQMKEIHPFMASVLNSVIEPVTLECLTPDLTYQLLGERAYALAVTFEDREKAVRYQENWLKANMPQNWNCHIFRQKEAKDWWGTFSRIGPNGSLENVTDQGNVKIALKVGSKNSDVFTILEYCHRLGKSDGLDVEAHGGMGHGISRVYLEGDDETLIASVEKIRQFVEQKKGYVVVQHSPLKLRQRLNIWGEKPNYFSLLEGIKRAIDPNGVLNPNRFVGGL